ncbi:MAG: hydrogenase formation protein HypD, partial [Synechococcaceae bacterium WB8_1B_136]|nr:hydrogenase formation protein HypD [Synechococcaceae bacterium WB8_1B_136]
MVSGVPAPASPEQLLEEIRRCCSRPWTLMEVCGGQTHALLRHGIDQLLPPEITLIHGPGCPVCVTASERIDQALELAAQPDVILCSFGDMLRVPGSQVPSWQVPGSQGRTLLERRAAGADVRVVYAPLDVLELARRHPERLVVFFAVGFETTAPSTALLAQRALAEGLTNLALLVGHVRVPPVLEVMLSNPACRVQGVLAAGHVCTVMGEEAYGQLVERHRRPIVVTGFEANELLRGILHCVRQLERGEQRLENVYRRAVRECGNGSARALVEAVFQPEDTPWRGLGTIPRGGLRLRPPYDSLAVER